jgi:hypothetical protein
VEPDIVDQLNCRKVNYIDGQRFGAHRFISAAGVDREPRMRSRGSASVKYWRDQGMIERWLDNYSIRCFSNTGIDFSIKEV